MTLPEFEEMFNAQGRSCAICGTVDFGPRGPQIDHCHATGAVRGILCVNCNNGLGRFGDDPALLRRAADFLDSLSRSGG